MEKERQEALEWFVQFANMNLKTIKPGDKAKLLVESEEYLLPMKDLEKAGLGGPVSDNLYKLYEPLGLTRKDVEKKRMGIMAWASEIPKKHTLEYWAMIEDLQKIVLETLREVSGHGGDTVRFGFGWEGRMMVMAVWEKTLNLSFIPCASTHHEYIQLKIYQLLNGLPRGAIEKCPGCKKYFLNPSFRKKTFCSPRCMWRVNTAKRREADREGYNEYQAKLMKDRYREKNGHPRLKTKSRKAKKGE